MDETTDTTPKVEKVKKVKKSDVINVEAEEVVEQSVVIIDTINQELEKRNITEEALQMMEEEFPKLTILDINDRTGYKEVTEALTMLRNTRTLTIDVCKGARDEHIRIQKNIIKTENAIVDRIKKVEAILAAKRKVIDEEKDRIKNEKDTLEQSRLQERAVKLIEYGMNFTGDAYVLDDIKISVLSVKTADEFTFSALFAAVETRYKAIQETKRFEEEQREIAAVNAKRILEEQLAQAEVLKQKEAELVARQAAIEAAELKAKQEAEARIKQEQEAKVRAEQDRVAAEQKAKDEVLKSRMSSLFSLGFAQKADTLVFSSMTIFIKDIASLTDKEWLMNLESHTDSVKAIKEKFENDRVAELERVKAEAIAAEKKRQQDADYADAIAAKEKEIELQRIAAMRPDSEKVDYLLHQINSTLIPEFSTPDYIKFGAYIKSTLESAVKHLQTKKPS